jgi:glutamyl-tRNA synthetase
MDLIYPCFCSRKELRDAVSAPHGATPVYPGTCAALSADERALKRKEKSPAIRLRVPDQRLEFEDVVIGKQSQHLRRDVGDFVIKRADGLFAYQFAVVVDDVQQGVTDVVRGADLLDSTARQLYLAGLINADNVIRYWHVPLVMDVSGQRMAKRDGSNSLAEWQAMGKHSDQLIGEFAYQLKLVDRNEPLSAEELALELTESAFIAALKTHA